MPPRISLGAALKQPLAFLKPQNASLSTTIPCQKLLGKRGGNIDLGGAKDLDQYITGDSNLKGMSGMYASFLEQSNSKNGKQRDQGRKNTEDQLAAKNLGIDYLRQIPRNWKQGDVYSPHDLSPSEAERYSKTQKKVRDVVDMLGCNSLDMYRNFAMVREFTNTTGRIRGSQFTGLRAVNQRKVAKAIRRSIGLGLHPSVHWHPETMLPQNRNSTQSVNGTFLERAGRPDRYGGGR